MGQAKRRGTLEERIAQADARKLEEHMRKAREHDEVLQLKSTIQPGQRRVLHGHLVCRCDERSTVQMIWGSRNPCKLCRSRDSAKTSGIHGRTMMAASIMMAAALGGLR